MSNTYFKATNTDGQTVIIEVGQDSGCYPVPTFPSCEIVVSDAGRIFLGDEDAEEFIREKIRQSWNGPETLRRTVSTLDTIKVRVCDDDPEKAGLYEWSEDLLGNKDWRAVVFWDIPAGCNDPIEHITDWEEDEIIESIGRDPAAYKMLEHSFGVVPLYIVDHRDMTLTRDAPSPSHTPNGYLVVSSSDDAQKLADEYTETLLAWASGENWFTAAYRPNETDEYLGIFLEAVPWERVSTVIESEYSVDVNAVIGEFESIEECLEHLRDEKER